jgi:exopolysaccharide biosynthesis predicted pyruvyltransferase EpsI
LLIFFKSFLEQAYRLGQRVILPVGGWFADKSISNNKKVKTEDTFVENKNLTTKTELFSKSFLEQIYRFGQLAKLQVGG